MLFPYISRQYTGVTASGSGMTFAILQDSVACNHDRRVGHCEPHNFFWNAVDGYHPTLLSVPRKTFCSEALARCRPLQVVVGNAALVLLPARAKYCGRYICHSRCVRIRLGGDIQPVCSRTSD